MKVLNICSDDYANFSHDNANALRSVGMKVVDIKRIPHVFCYSTQSELANEEKLKQQIYGADIIQVFHSCTWALEKVRKFAKSSANIYVYHAGTVYRQNPTRFNNIFNPIVKKSVLALPEFWEKGAKNPVYLVGAVDTEYLKPEIINIKKPYTVAHYPSNYRVKGTDVILEMMQKVLIFSGNEIKFNWATDHVPYHDQVKRMLKCDIYIELFAPEQTGKPYGSFGITALEASALGKVVVTQSLFDLVYKEQYGIENPFVKCYDKRDFIFKMVELLGNTPNQIKEKQEQTRNWIEAVHSYKATGNRIKEKIFEI